MTPSQSLYLIRHGETAWALEGKHTGRTDISLTTKGRQDTLALKKILPSSFSTIFCSPLKRAQESCSLCFEGSQPILSPSLMEWDYGDFEGRTSIDIRSEHPDWNLFTQGAPHGESPQDVEKRIRSFFTLLDPLEGNVAIVAHAHLLRSLTALWLGLPLQAASLFFLKTSSLSILGYERSNRVIRLWNDTPYEKIF